MRVVPGSGPWRVRAVLPVGLALVLVVAAWLPASAAESVIEALQNEYIRIADSARPSVVVVEAEGKAVKVPNVDDLEIPEPFRDLIPKNRVPNVPNVSSGSGFIIDPDGWVLTNSHVVRGARKITVTTIGGKKFTVEKHHIDPLTDVAVLKVDPGTEKLTPATLGDSAGVKVGQIVVAIGNPFGVGVSFTTGVVSQLGIDMPAPQTDEQGRAIRAIRNLIQTDAAINPGNSGGPLLDISGQVVGITTAIVSRSTGSEGVGFAIPINTARRIADQLMQTGKVSRAWVGIMMEAKSKEELAALGAPEGGAFVSQIRADGPAAGSGLQEGDIIVGYSTKAGASDDELTPIRSSDDLVSEVEASTPGSEVTLKVLRFKEPVRIAVKLGEFPAELAGTAEPQVTKAEAGALGLTVSEVTDDTVKEMGLPKKAGVVVQEVSADSPAAGALQPGDVILGIDGQPVTSVADFHDLIGKLEGKPVTVLTIKRKEGDRTMADTVMVPLGEGR